VGKPAGLPRFWAYLGLKVVCSTQPGLGNFGDCVVIWLVVFQVSQTISLQTGVLNGCHKLVESYRNADDRVCLPTLLNMGFMEDTSVEQRNLIQN